MYAAAAATAFCAFILVNMVIALRKRNISEALDGFIRNTFILCAFALSAYIISLILYWSGSTWNYVRLYPAFMVARGLGLYDGFSGGIISGFDYGPLAALIYLPAALFPTARTAVLSGGCTAALITFLPVLLIYMLDRRRGRVSHGGFILFALLAVNSNSLSNTLFQVHADAPALSLGAFSCMALYYHRRQKALLFISSLCTALCCGARLSMAPLLLALPIYVYLTEGRKSLLTYLSFILASLLLTTASCAALFNPPGLWLTMLIPFHQPLQGSPESIMELAGEYHLPLFLLILSITAQHLFVNDRKPIAFRTYMTENRWTVFALAGLMLIPSSLMGKMSTGGTISSFSFATYFLSIAATLAFSRLILLFQQDNHRRAYDLIRILAVIFLLSGTAMRVFSLADLQHTADPLHRACIYIREHPGGIYFPGNPLLHAMVENRFYHLPYGLYDRELAGLPADRAQVLHGIPEHIPIIALNNKDISDRADYIFRYFPGFSRKADIPDLPGWSIYERQ